ncbi:unnamed protein product [Bursaphelenchus xylophilus]|uniref:(pine wood nematode) hypothetical protein n=1 Tax=Bursaphelenchus xylophilus TaxID=6326 RepID=A0A7I8WRL4_BURXY|nr:unnamed protein product [Bursaphelenchus xylophilus]CAG9114392.1 unnamed protein product [Bursaphelenchus xylophilus]
MQSLTQLLIISTLSLSVFCQYDAAPKPAEPVKQSSDYAAAPEAPAPAPPAPAAAPTPASPPTTTKPKLEVHQAIYDGLGGNFAEEQADPTSPHVEIAATNPKKSDGGQSQAIYAAGSAEAETPEAAPAAEKAAEPAPAPEKAAEPAPAPKPEAKKEPAPSQAYRQARLRF